MPILYSRCREAGLTEADAEDLVQETFIKVRRSIPDFDRQRRGSFRCWVNRIRSNAVIDYQRKMARSERASGDSQMKTMLDNVAADIDEETSLSSVDPDYVQIIAGAVKVMKDRFEPHVYQAFEMTQIEGIPAPEAAEKLGKTPVAVRQATWRVRRALKEYLKDLLE